MARLDSRALRVTTIACAAGYPLALAACALAFRFIGERWWVTAAGLYLPRLGFGLPLPFVAVAAHLWAPRRYLALQAVSLGILVFPLMGFSPGIGRWLPRPAGPTVRVMSLNVGAGPATIPVVVEQVQQFGGDILLLQDAGARVALRLEGLLEGWTVRADGEFVIAARGAIREVYVPPPLVYATGSGGAHYVHYTLETPLGLIDVFNVHPTTPRPAIEEIRGVGLRYEIASGRLFAGKARDAVAWNAFRRNRQVSGIAARAAASPRAVIIAGDTNLPGLSWTLNEHLGGFRDAFRWAGLGFGYTFPSRRPWMRIDRILTSRHLRALESGVGTATPSDHRMVFAVLARQAG
jgi:endonuclease/exonuclease/phosphatase family metal-dependent hydrolase